MQCALWSLRVHCAHPICQEIVYKNDYKIPIYACTPNYGSLAWKTKKLGKQCTMCTAQSCVLSTFCLIFKPQAPGGKILKIQAKCEKLHARLQGVLQKFAGLFKKFSKVTTFHSKGCPIFGIKTDLFQHKNWIWEFLYQYISIFSKSVLKCLFAGLSKSVEKSTKNGKLDSFNISNVLFLKLKSSIFAFVKKIAFAVRVMNRWVRDG